MFRSDDVLNTKLGPHRRRESLFFDADNNIIHASSGILGVSREETILIKLIQALSIF